MIVKPSSIVVIVGPTGVGKTGVALELAKLFGAEIVSADAMQVYKNMDIGTAKPSKKDLAAIPHHLVDVVYPDESFNAARFAEMADSAIETIKTNKRPIFVAGGSGLYIKALTMGLFAIEQSDPAIKDRLRKQLEIHGRTELLRRLETIDPKTAAKLNPADTYRLLRALEIFELTGKPMSLHHASHQFSSPRYNTLKIGLTIDRAMLYDRINNRVDQMVEHGLLDEVKGLLDCGYDPRLKPMQSIGYKHMVDHLINDVPWNLTIELLKRDTRRYAKRQYTWFRADPQVEWLHPGQFDEMRMKIEPFLFH